jgi:hypothetical protein
MEVVSLEISINKAVASFAPAYPRCIWGWLGSFFLAELQRLESDSRGIQPGGLVNKLDAHRCFEVVLRRCF